MNAYFVISLLFVGLVHCYPPDYDSYYPFGGSEQDPFEEDKCECIDEVRQRKITFHHGNSVFLPCHTDAENCSIGWYMNGEIIKNTTRRVYGKIRFKNFRRTGLLIFNMTKEDEGNYTVILKNDLTSGSRSYIVSNVDQPPDSRERNPTSDTIPFDTSTIKNDSVYWLRIMEKQRWFQRVSINQHYTLNCYFFSKSQNFTVDWTAHYVNGITPEELKYDSKYTFDVHQYKCSPIDQFHRLEYDENISQMYQDVNAPGYCYKAFLSSNTTLMDNAMFSCRVKTPLANTITASFDLLVMGNGINGISEYSALGLAMNKIRPTVCDGTTFIITCSSSQEVQLALTYNKNDSDNNYKLLGKTEQVKLFSNMIHHKDELKYEIKAVSKKDSGYYSCWAFRYTHRIRRKLVVVNCDTKTSHTKWIGVGVFVLLFLFLGITITYWCRRSPRILVVTQFQNELIYRWPENSPSSTFESESGTNSQVFREPILIPEIRMRQIPHSGTSSSCYYILPVDMKWEISRTKIQITGILGLGNWGEVSAASLFEDNVCRKIAIKTVRDETSQDHVTSLLKEGEIMKQLHLHPNIIQLIGMCTTSDGPPMILMELAELGSLKKFLLSNSDVSPTDMIQFSLDVCCGMDYLASRHIIHRDLASRNIMVMGDKRCKIADFGLTRQTEYYAITSHTELPVRWMAPEALDRLPISFKSDVWSFGIVMWEIFSCGRTPYPDIDPFHLATHQKQGGRNLCPLYASDDEYEVMLRCWHLDPRERPDFSQLTRLLQLCEGKRSSDYISMLDMTSNSSTSPAYFDF